jgi:TonB family protein
MDERPRPFFFAASEVSGGGYRRGTQAGAASVVIHAVVIALLCLLAGGSPPRSPATQRPWRVTRLVLAPFPAPPSDGGGGGGGRSPLPANRGQAPRFADHQFVPPSPLTDTSSFQLPMEPTLVGPPEVRLPQVGAAIWGDPTALPGPPSPGPGCCGGIGTGLHGGIGPGDGPGFGPGEKGGYTNVFVPGRGGVSLPVPLYKVEPEYSEEARKAKFQGTVVLEIVIDERGYPTNFRFLNALGLGLDEKAVEAVRQWRFRPAMKNGKPVAVVARVEVNFRLL